MSRFPANSTSSPFTRRALALLCVALCVAAPLVVIFRLSDRAEALHGISVQLDQIQLDAQRGSATTAEVGRRLQSAESLLAAEQDRLWLIRAEADDLAALGSRMREIRSDCARLDIVAACLNDVRAALVAPDPPALGDAQIRVRTAIVELDQLPSAARTSNNSPANGMPASKQREALRNVLSLLHTAFAHAEAGNEAAAQASMNYLLHSSPADAAWREQVKQLSYELPAAVRQIRAARIYEAESKRQAFVEAIDDFRFDEADRALVQWKALSGDAASYSFFESLEKLLDAFRTERRLDANLALEELSKRVGTERGRTFVAQLDQAVELYWELVKLERRAKFEDDRAAHRRLWAPFEDAVRQAATAAHARHRQRRDVPLFEYVRQFGAPPDDRPPPATISGRLLVGDVTGNWQLSGPFPYVAASSKWPQPPAVDEPATIMCIVDRDFHSIGTYSSFLGSNSPVGYDETATVVVVRWPECTADAVFRLHNRAAETVIYSPGITSYGRVDLETLRMWANVRCRPKE
jgi:hypothetical protein